MAKNGSYGVNIDLLSISSKFDVSAIWINKYLQILISFVKNCSKIIILFNVIQL